MMCDEQQFDFHQPDEQTQEPSHFNFDFFSLISKPRDYYYKVLEVDCDATEEEIRSNYIRLALKWHPDKRKDGGIATSKFQEISEAYQVLSDPAKRREYDTEYNYITEYLDRHKSLILTCNGLGMKYAIW